MNLGHTTVHEAQGLNIASAFLSIRDVPRDKYDEYLLLGGEPRDSVSNARNLFDESNEEDRKWLKTARAYLGMRR